MESEGVVDVSGVLRSAPFHQSGLFFSHLSGPFQHPRIRRTDGVKTSSSRGAERHVVLTDSEGGAGRHR